MLREYRAFLKIGVKELSVKMAVENLNTRTGRVNLSQNEFQNFSVL